MNATRPASSEADRTLRRSVHARLVGTGAVDLLVGAPRGELHQRIGALLLEAEPLLSTDRHDRLVRELAADVVGLGALEPLLDDPTVTEVMINGPGRAYVERAGRLVAVPTTLDATEILRIVERILAPIGLRLDRSSPMVDARLPDGSRLHAVLAPLAIDGPCLTIRRFGALAVPLEAFGLGTEGTEFLEWAVRAGWNLLVAGGTGAGKTTLLNALSGAIDPDERIVTIEETAELRLAQPHVVRLEARPANAEGAGAFSVRDLVRAALRMRPDRLIVGEVRGAEALDLLQALNTGHHGSLSTVHANGPADALRRVTTLALFGGVGLPHEAIREQLCASVDALVQVSRSAGGSREVVSITEVPEPGVPVEVRPLFVRRAGELVAVGTPVRPARRSAPDSAR